MYLRTKIDVVSMKIVEFYLPRSLIFLLQHFHTTYLLTYCTLNNIISLAWKCNSAVTLQPLFITITIDNDKSAVRLIYNNFTRV